MNHCHSKRSSIEARAWLQEGLGQAQLPEGMGGPLGQVGGALNVWPGKACRGVSVCANSHLEAAIRRLDLPLIAGHTLGECDRGRKGVTDVPRGDRISYSFGLKKD